MKINWAILCYRDNEDGSMNILHACCYEERPTQKIADSLREELSGMIDEEYEMLLIDRENGFKYFEELGIPETFEELDNNKTN